MKIVVDSNVYASSLMSPAAGVPGKLLQKLLSKQDYEIVASEILSELSRIVWYPKVRSRISLTDEELEDWLLALKLVVEIIDISSLFYLTPIVLDDPDDDIYILTALASGTNHIVSGDKHLLGMNPYQGIKIIRPAEFLALSIIEPQ